MKNILPYSISDLNIEQLKNQRIFYASDDEIKILRSLPAIFVKSRPFLKNMKIEINWK